MSKNIYGDPCGSYYKKEFGVTKVEEGQVSVFMEILSLDGKLRDLLKKTEELIEEGWESIEFSSDSYYDDGNTVCISVAKLRKATDDEAACWDELVKKRLLAETELKRKQYNDLKKQFGIEDL